MGDGSVVHLAPESGSRVALADDTGRFCVRRVPMESFAGGKKVQVVNHQRRHTADQCTAIAERAIGQCGYHLLENNCEHFATYCATGQADSRQIELSQGTAVSVASALAKSFWVLTGRTAVSSVQRVAVRLHPLSLVADGVEAVAIASSCAVGLSGRQARRVARASGDLTAFAVGFLSSGPVGGAVSLALHRSSTELAESLCQWIRNRLSTGGTGNADVSRTGGTLRR